MSKRFGATVALRDARITITPGESHALVGRNGAGKSTLVSVLTGLQQPDTGTLRFSGGPAPAVGDIDAWRSKVACVYQKSTIIQDLTVAENLFLNRQSDGALRPIRWKQLRARAEELLAGYGVDVKADARARDLTVEQRQFVEIARALSFGARFIILDEPTAKLDARGINRLFDKLRDLQRQGVAFLFISHHLQEVYDLCTTVTVYRDAAHILTAPVAELGHQALVEAMTGETTRTAAAAVENRPPLRAGAPELLTVEGLTLPGACQDLSLTVRAGEVVGLAGAAASGNVRVGETVAGLHRPEQGTISVGGRRVRGGSVPSALAVGVGLVPEDRHLQGLVNNRSVAENATLTVTDQLGPYGTVLPARTRSFAQRMIRDLDIKTPGGATPVSALSGGNQQKVVVARALATDPQVLVAIRPTNGVDVKSKEFLLRRIRQVADGGKAALIVSDELDDLKVCDRLVVMFHGRAVAEFDRGWKDEHVVAAMEGVADRSEAPAGAAPHTGGGAPTDAHTSAGDFSSDPSSADPASADPTPAGPGPADPEPADPTAGTTEEHGR
ncbi:sugar ABC transporter ATP-binding protein [Streptomyces sp. ND05-3B]|nr:sugar ABC transporter ATP-binding protein [Streptomyces caniscabiei]MBE4761457.1 sugar ABC transporter ATP-binding protein [Streptomyces caniscabiei]MBE4775453.1 sugar ABC transporter ATP-binding protein [Streptomyces caniscabiei]MBE4789874.1 sugar ABC transporter ATP-binding protein [Streptomyces caniscabiei]MBE4799106.1 sugar ABC transporter ATP-binding protein [Streptomyces caniscabiei]